MFRFIYLLTVILPFFAFAEEYQFVGKHYFASFYGCNSEALNNHEGIKETLKKAATAAGATVLSEADHAFTPAGYTLVVVLSESHLSIHTYPDYGACFIDFFTCGDSCKPDVFEKIIGDYLAPQEISSQVIHRS